MRYTSLHIRSRVEVRFRQWSRKGYAVFASLGRKVTVGRVCKGIADVSLNKSAEESCMFEALYGRSLLSDTAGGSALMSEEGSLSVCLLDGRYAEGGCFLLPVAELCPAGDGSSIERISKKVDMSCPFFISPLRGNEKGTFYFV